MDVSFCELRQKDVVNIVDGKSMGRIIDIIFTLNGRVCGIVVPACKKFFKGLGSTDTIFIKWNNILKLGEDTILVELDSTVETETKTP